MPLVTPVTKPKLLTVATAGAADTHALLAAAVPEPVSCVVANLHKRLLYLLLLATGLP